MECVGTLLNTLCAPDVFVDVILVVVGVGVM